MSERLWEYRGYWIRRLGNSPKLYACWYDERGGREARRTLGTEILNEAKEKLVGSAKVDSTRAPDRVMIMAALDHYYENDVKAKPSAEPARRAIEVVNQFLLERLVPAAPVSAFGPLRQLEFMQWSHDGFGHKAATIARNLSVVNAAFRFGMRLTIVTDGLGNRHELQLLDSAPNVTTQGKRVADLLALPAPGAREWLPSFQEFGAFIDKIDKRKENLFRFVIIALNTWARPEAITDLRVGKQVDFENRLIDLNPPGRRQTNKYRPRLPLTNNLAEWLRFWAADSPLQWDGQAIGEMGQTFKRHAVACGLDHFTQGTIRHFMATQVRRVKPRVSKEQRDAWLGHDEKRTAEFYESFDPEFLRECRLATEKVIAQLQKHTKRDLFTRKLRASEGVVAQHKSASMERKSRVIKGSNGGRTKDRTWDPYDVNVVLSR